MREIYLAGGCFWGTEKYLSQIFGTVSTEVGYANGKTENPTYQEVCYNDTGHAETVRVVYDPSRISLNFLLELFFESIDPISVNRQGNDVGTQYRTGIYYADENDAPIIEEALNKLRQKFTKPIAVEAMPLKNFFRAEEYHQKYLDKNPYGYCHIPKSKFEQAASKSRARAKIND
ncbi:MAG: peptide-methionine (S)-S-oxide reductase MsrA [Christensenellales bacterium]|jgi:methionine-S-sulfoxide reductase